MLEKFFAFGVKVSFDLVTNKYFGLFANVFAAEYCLYSELIEKVFHIKVFFCMPRFLFETLLRA